MDIDVEPFDSDDLRFGRSEWPWLLARSTGKTLRGAQCPLVFVGGVPLVVLSSAAEVRRREGLLRGHD
jgi:hypothetical protein